MIFLSPFLALLWPFFPRLNSYLTSRLPFNYLQQWRLFPTIIKIYFPAAIYLESV